MTRDNEWDWTTFAWGNLVTGLFGFLISVAGILSVKITSPVTHMFSSVRALYPLRSMRILTTDASLVRRLLEAYCKSHWVSRSLETYLPRKTP